MGFFQLFNPFMQELTCIANFLKTLKISKIPYKNSMKFTVLFESVSSADLISQYLSAKETWNIELLDIEF